MELKDSDLVVDEYGNYYCMVKETWREGKQSVKLANAFMKYSMEKRFDFDDIPDMVKSLGDYNKKPIGSVALHKLKSWVKMRQDGSLTSNVYNLKEVMENIDVEFKQLEEYI